MIKQTFPLVIIAILAFVFLHAQGDNAMDELDAKTYRQHNNSQRTIANEMWTELTLRGNEHLLDVGCGDGQTTHQMADALPDGQVTGIDPSPSMVETAEEHQLSNLQFEQRGAHDINEVETYDIITAFACLHYVPNIDHALEKIYHALKPGGRFLATCYTTDGGMGKHQTDLLCSPRWSLLARPSGLNLFSTAEHKKILAALPWRYTLQEEHRTALVDEVSFRRNTEVFAPLILDCSDEERSEFVDALLDRFRRPDQPFQANYVVIKIFAEKSC